MTPNIGKISLQVIFYNIIFIKVKGGRNTEVMLYNNVNVQLCTVSARLYSIYSTSGLELWKSKDRNYYDAKFKRIKIK